MTKQFAVFESLYNHKRTAINQTVFGGFYIERLDYDGLFMSGATSDINPTLLGLFQNPEFYKCVKSPESLYHVWHICLCLECEKKGGRFFNHSQSSFNEHLRFINPTDLFTFHTVQSDI